VTTLETDLAVTRDDVLVLSHDPLLNPDLVRGPDGKWLAAKGRRFARCTIRADALRRRTSRSIEPLRAQFPQQEPVDGERVPTLAQLFALVRDSGKPVRLNSRRRSIRRAR
jgi:glycerophosphoryl diester phosphodiesterase